MIHSVLATRSCKNAFYQLGMTPKVYRLTYSILATILTVLWLGFVHQLPDSTLYRTHGWVNGLMVVIQLVGMGIVVLSLRAIDTSAFLGFSASPEKQDSFTEHGIYRYIRHPMYSGVMLTLLASPVQTGNSMNLFAIIILYFIIGSRFEERRMQTIHPEYSDYRRQVPAFIPWPRVGRTHE